MLLSLLLVLSCSVIKFFAVLRRVILEGPCRRGPVWSWGVAAAAAMMTVASVEHQSHTLCLSQARTDLSCTANIARACRGSQS